MYYNKYLIHYYQYFTVDNPNVHRHLQIMAPSLHYQMATRFFTNCEMKMKTVGRRNRKMSRHSPDLPAKTIMNKGEQKWQKFLLLTIVLPTVR